MANRVGIRIDPRSKESLHRQLFEQIVARIRSGTWPGGFRLPPTRTLATQIGTHRNTVVRAYADLESAGFVHSRTGSGTYVATLADGAPVATSVTHGGVDWSAIVSRAVGAETLTRFERAFSRTAPKSAIQLNRMQPSPDLIPRDLLRRCIEHVFRTEGAAALGYAPRDGVLRLRGLIAEDLPPKGIPARAEDVLVTTGSQQGLDLLARAFIDPGDVFLVEETTYAGALNILSAAGARLVPIARDAEGPDLAALARAARSGAKGLYLMPTCQNPTGACITAERREQIARWSEQHGVPIIEDDYCADLYLADDAPPVALRTLSGDVVYIGSFSKSLAPSLRIGYVLCPPALRSRLLTLKHSLDLGTSALLQHALAEFLERGYYRAHLRRVVDTYRKRRDALDRALRRNLPKRIVWQTPVAGLAMWVPFGEQLEQLDEEARRQGVMVGPSTLNAVHASHRGGVRITYCAEPEDRLVEGARRLGRAVAAVERVSGRRSAVAPGP